DFFPREQADFFTAKDREVLSKGMLEDIPEEPIDTPGGTRWLHTRKIPILDDAGEPLYLLGISIDITERKRAQELLQASHQQREEMQEIERAAEKAAALTNQLLAFSRQQVMQLRILDLNAVVRGMERMLPRMLGEDIQLHIRTAPDLQTVRADPGQIEQVLMN